jgi:hypothetical protein
VVGGDQDQGPAVLTCVVEADADRPVELERVADGTLFLSSVPAASGARPQPASTSAGSPA